MTSRRPGGARRIRTVQRWLHLVSGVLLLAFVYLAPAVGPAFTDAVRWLVFPLLAATGIAMWQWPRIRRIQRHWRAVA